MTDQERQLIEGLIGRVQNAPAPQVDRDADDLIRRGIGARPDALYILTQTVLIQEMALNQAKAQIEELRQHAPQANTSFLGGAPGGYQPGGYQGSGYAQQAPPPQYDYAPAPQGGRFSGFLHNAMQTAAGVVAGEVAFSALGSIFGGHGGGSGFFGGGSGISPGSETIVNNYYGDDQRDEHGFGSSDGGLSPDLEDRRFDSGDNSGDNGGGDNFDSQQDDGSSYDDGSGSGSDV